MAYRLQFIKSLSLLYGNFNGSFANLAKSICEVVFFFTAMLLDINSSVDRNLLLA